MCPWMWSSEVREFIRLICEKDDNKITINEHSSYFQFNSQHGKSTNKFYIDQNTRHPVASQPNVNP